MIADKYIGTPGLSITLRSTATAFGGSTSHNVLRNATLGAYAINIIQGSQNF